MILAKLEITSTCELLEIPTPFPVRNSRVLLLEPADTCVAATKLHLVDARIRELRDLRKELASLVADCDANTQDTQCPVIQRLAL